MKRLKFCKKQRPFPKYTLKRAYRLFILLKVFIRATLLLINFGHFDVVKIYPINLVKGSLSVLVSISACSLFRYCIFHQRLIVFEGSHQPLNYVLYYALSYPSRQRKVIFVFKRKSLLRLRSFLVTAIFTRKFSVFCWLIVFTIVN